METLTATELAVLGLTAQHPGDLEQIYEHLHAPPRSIRLADAADAVRSLVHKGLIAARTEEAETSPDDVSRLWKAHFEATPQAHEMLGHCSPGPPPGWPKGRVYPGMFQGMIPDISFDDFKENRRDMARRSSKDVDDD